MNGRNLGMGYKGMDEREWMSGEQLKRGRVGELGYWRTIRGMDGKRDGME